MSCLPAINLLEGTFHVKVVEGSFNKALFNAYADDLMEVMNPYDPVKHNPNSVLILDNCRIHKDPELLARFRQK